MDCAGLRQREICSHSNVVVRTRIDQVPAAIMRRLWLTQAVVRPRRREMLRQTRKWLQ